MKASTFYMSFSQSSLYGRLCDLIDEAQTSNAFTDLNQLFEWAKANAVGLDFFKDDELDDLAVLIQAGFVKTENGLYWANYGGRCR